MKTNKILLSGFVGGVAYFFLGWLVYGLILKSAESMPESIMKEPMAMWAMALSCLVFGMLIAIIFGRWAGISTLATGAAAGAVLGFLMSLWIDLSMFSMYNFLSMQGLIIDVIASAVISGVVGGVVGWMLGMGKDS